MNERKNNKGHDFVTAISMTKPKTFEGEFSYYNVTVVCHGNHISNKKKKPWLHKLFLLVSDASDNTSASLCTHKNVS